ncbi:LTA synthase family protein [Paenibacillus sp. sgz500958]|uniref:LTA synthase family protein n=1 Tax=Paenibacillus sp. sgz500958 TaxID=3242475 RepID=UPI0036D27136
MNPSTTHKSIRRALVLLITLLLIFSGYYEYSANKITAIWNQNHGVPFVIGRNRNYFAAGAGYNLIVVQLESFQNFVLNTSVDGQELTPVMNKLATEGLYFPYIFQQIGSGNTSDAEFMSNTSIYPVGASAMSTKYGNRELPSMAKLLHPRGYHADTFHVNDVSFWDRNLMYPALGFDSYYDKPYFPVAKFNRFGASDEALYRVGINKMKTLHKHHKKFYAQFITVSSHAPFSIPKQSRRLKLNPKLSGTPLGDYLTAVNYTDYALGTFMDKLKTTGLWDNSVVVFYGDHYGLHKKKFNPKKISETLGITYHKQISTFNVPLIIHIPGERQGVIVEQTGGQIDILPTLANIMGIDLKREGFTAFGQDLLNTSHNVIGMRYYMPTGTFFNNDILFIPGKNGFEDGKATSIRTLQNIEDITPFKSDYDYIKKWMKLSDKYVKQLPIRREVQAETDN